MIPILVSLLVAGALCWIASLILPAGPPFYIACVVIVLACLGGYIGFGGRIAHGGTHISSGLPSSH